MTALEHQLDAHRLTTAEIFYHLPDHPSLLQSYLWQDYDLAPKFPALHRFLDYWEQNSGGPAPFGLGRQRSASAGARPGAWRMPV